MKIANKRWFRFGALLLALAMVAAACGDDSDGDSDATTSTTGGGGATTTTQADSMQSVTLALSTTSSFGYGFHIAKGLGFYADEGLDVELQGTGGSSDVAQILAAGNAEAGMGVPGAMLPAIEAGPPNLLYHDRIGSLQ